MRWNQLSRDQQVALAAWYILADAETPSLREELPVEYSLALSELAATCGKYYPRRFLRRRLTTGLPRHPHRKPRVTRAK